MIQVHKLLISPNTKCTLTIVTDPSDATCTLTYNGQTYTTKTLEVEKGSTVIYSISATGYTTQTGSWVITSDTIQTITLNKQTYTLTVSTSPSNASCRLTYNGEYYYQKTLTVEYGSTVSYYVYGVTGYDNTSGSWTITGTTTKTVTMYRTTYYLGIFVYDKNNTNKIKNATITVTGTTTGTQTKYSDTYRQYFYAYYGNSMSYSVSYSGYETVTGNSGAMYGSKNITVNLKKLVTLTVSPTPSDATVTLTASGYSQSGNTITVAEGTNVSYSVSKTGYTTQTGSWTINSDTTQTITLSPSTCTLTVVNNVPSSTCVLNYNGSDHTATSATVTTGTSITCKITYLSALASSGASLNESNSVIASSTVTMNSNKTLTCNPVVSQVTSPYNNFTASGAMGGTSIAVTSSGDYSTYHSWKAFDGKDSTMWGLTRGNSGYLEIYYPYPVKIQSFTYMNNYSSAQSRTPESGSVEGSNDGNSWTSLKTFTNSVTGTKVSWTITISSSVYYRYYKFNFEKTSSTNYILYCTELTANVYYISGVSFT